MERTRFHTWSCSVARTLDIVGDGWTPLILREAYFGTKRFEAFQTSLGISRNILTRRLKRLVDEELFIKKRYQASPPRFEYHLTDKGRDLFGVVAAMLRWGDDWLAGDAGAPLELFDRTTGERVRPLVVDERTGRRIDVRELVARPGPGHVEREEE